MAIARYARYAAFAAFPLGLLFGGVFSSGQDKVGAAYAYVTGSILGLIGAAFFFVCYWVLKSARRTKLLVRFGWIPALLLTGWIAIYFLKPQEYTLSVHNASATDLTSIEVVLAGSTISISELKSRTSASTEGLTVAPESALTISWLDANGNQQSVFVESRDPPHHRYDGGTLWIYIRDENLADVMFTWQSTPLF